MSINNQFTSITQYDKQFDNIFVNPSKKGFSCSFFSLITAWKFLNGEIADSLSHETSIAQSLLAQSAYDVEFGISFEEMLLTYTNINPTQICATTVELINSGEIGFDKIFPPVVDDTKIAIIILKNERYLTILIDQNSYKFRDCHENTQYDFKSIDELLSHLINAYQFTDNVNVGGINYYDYSSIEFLILNEKFYLGITDIIGIKNEPNDPNINCDKNDTQDNHMTENEILYMKILEEEINEEFAENLQMADNYVEF